MQIMPAAPEAVPSAGDEHAAPPRPTTFRMLTAPLLARLHLPPKPSPAVVHLAVKMVVAGTLAWWLCTLLGAQRPLFAVLVPLVAMGGDPFSSVNVSVSRTLGVFAGVLLGLAVLQLSLPSTPLVALLLSLSLLAGLVIRIGDGALNTQVAITGMFMLYVGVAAKAQSVGVARIWETAVGAGVAVAVSALVWPPDPLREAHRRVARLRGWLREDLTAIAGLLAAPDLDGAEQQLERVRERSLDAVRDLFELERAERALRLNPRRRTDAADFALERDRLTAAARQYRHLRTIARIVADAAADEPPLPPAQRQRLTDTIATITAAATDGQILPPPVEPGELDDPRAVGLAVKLRQMVDDLASSRPNV
jgi:uncharacterized membrane protein YgaE (UPF0421/DUF939 family)